MKLDWNYIVTDEMMKEYKKSKIAKRECLRCEKKFTSSNKFNRICLDCKNTDDNALYTSLEKPKEKE